MATKPRAAGDIVKLKITLRDIRPPIWRRLLVPGQMTLRQLHGAIQDSFGWEEAHLYAFDVNGERYGNPEMLDGGASDARLTLSTLRTRGIKRFGYTYDFGDNWEHDILIEGSEPPVPGQFYPTCVAGKRHGPPEDCGGSFGYEHMLGILADPAHKDYEEQLEWVGDQYDPEAFSIDDVNKALRMRFMPRKQSVKPHD